MEQTRSGRFGRAVSYLGVVWLMTCVLFVIATLVLAIFYARLDESRARKNRVALNPTALKSMSAADANRLFIECERIGKTTVPRPWVEYSERVSSFPGVHVDPAKPIPIRRTAAAQSPAPPKRVVWLFGGSTVFGYNVPDDQTLAAHLQNELQRRYPGTIVINHGHLGHDSSQELALLEWLLRSGQHADAAIFIDGLNDARHEVDPPLDDYDTKKWVTIDPMFPPVRVVRAVLRRFGKDDHPQPVWPPPADDVAGRARDAATRYLVNVRGSRAIADASGIPSLFILQPTSYDRPPAKDAVEARAHAATNWNPVVKPFNEIVRTEGREIVDLTGAFETQTYANTYVDPWHYGDEASRQLAAMIANAVIERRLLENGPHS